MLRSSRTSSGGPRQTLLPACLALLLGLVLAAGILAAPAHAAGHDGGSGTVRQPRPLRDGVTAVVRLDPADGTAAVGVDDEVGGKGGVSFEVLADGRSVLTTEVLDGTGAARRIDVDVTGVERLTLRVTDGGDGVDSDHADRADARLMA